MKMNALGLTVLLLGCASVGGTAAVVAPSTLNTNADAYDGKLVVVEGYLLLDPQARHFYESEALESEFVRMVKENPPSFDPGAYDKYCLTLLNADFLEQHRDLFSGKTIRIRGRFIKNYLDGSVIDLQACASPGALVVDSDDVRRLYRDLSR